MSDDWLDELIEATREWVIDVNALRLERGQPLFCIPEIWGL